MEKYNQNEPKFNSAYSRNNLPKIKNGAYIVNIDECDSIGTQWIAFYVNAENVTYIDSFRFEHIPREIRKFFGNKNIIINIYRIQAYDSMCKYFCTRFIDFIKFIKEYKFTFSWWIENEWQNNIKMFSMMRIYLDVCYKYRKFESLTISYILKKH